MRHASATHARLDGGRGARAAHVARSRQAARIARQAASDVVGAPMSSSAAANREVILSRLADALSASRTIAQECAAAGAEGGSLRLATTAAALKVELLRLNAAVGLLARVTTGEIRLHAALLEGTD